MGVATLQIGRVYINHVVLYWFGRVHIPSIVMMAVSLDPDPITASDDYVTFRSSIPQKKVGLDNLKPHPHYNFFDRLL